MISIASGDLKSTAPAPYSEARTRRNSSFSRSPSCTNSPLAMLSTGGADTVPVAGGAVGDGGPAAVTSSRVMALKA